MKQTHTSFLFLALLNFLACSSDTKQEQSNTVDSVKTVTEPASEFPVQNEVSHEPENTDIDIEAFTKYPFINDYPAVKSFLKENGIEFSLIAEDTIHAEQRTILFDSSRIDFLDSDPSYQDELGDLICSSDIRSPKFQFNQQVAIGMTQVEFLSRVNLNESSLVKDEAGVLYFENEIPFDEGYWRIKIFFKSGHLIRIQTEINPCYFEYGD